MRDIHVIDPVEYGKFLKAVDLSKKAFSGVDFKIDAEFHRPHVNMGSVVVIGKEISIIDYKAFIEICEMSENWEVYSFLDGFVQMNFAFYNITKLHITEDYHETTV